MSKAKAAKVLAAAAVAAGAGLVTSPASATVHQASSGTADRHGFVPRPIRSANPDTTGGCATANGVKVCGHITGSFQSVQSMSAYACVDTAAGMWIHVQIKSPFGRSEFSPHNTPTYFRANGNCTPHTTFPRSRFFQPVEAGGWHWIAWRKNPNGGYTSMVSKTLTVDP